MKKIKVSVIISIIKKMFKKSNKNIKARKDAPFFVSKDRKKIFGQEALEMIKKHNDSKYYDSEKGIISINELRWLEAQEYEKKVWLRDSKSNEDSNKIKMEGFENYRVIKNKNFDKIIELGCGPFTNLRYILKNIKFRKVTLLDPLLKEYLKKNNCTYKNGLIFGDNTWLNRKLGKKVPVTFSNSSIEEFEDADNFDLIVMIDVLEHCFNFESIKKKVLEISKKETYFVFSDKLFNAEEIKKELSITFDAGHPLKVNKNKIFEFLTDNFIEVYKKTKEFEAHRRERDLSYTNLYYIGYKI